MDNSKKRRYKSRAMRLMRVRKAVRGSTEKPRLSVSKTNLHLYAQLIDDAKGVTLAGIGTLSKENQNTEHNRKSKEAARLLGKQIAQLAKERNIERVVFDRGRNKYHGIIAELANSAREAGLQF